MDCKKKTKKKRFMGIVQFRKGGPFFASHSKCQMMQNAKGQEKKQQRAPLVVDDFVVEGLKAL